MYIDETGFDSYLCREYARAPKGEKIHEMVMGRKFQRTSIVAGKMGHKIVAPLQYSGTMNGELFERWFSERLLPAVPDDAVIIMDNASFHRKKHLSEIAEKFGRTLIFLPPYSPDLNPIEHFWHWLKKSVCDALPSSPNLSDAIFDAFKVR